jgi:hypothetical protein
MLPSGKLGLFFQNRIQTQPAFLRSSQPDRIIEWPPDSLQNI